MVLEEQNILIIRGKSEKELEEEEDSGRRYSSRIDPPPNLYKIDQIKAEMKNCVLKVLVQFLRRGRGRMCFSFFSCLIKDNGWHIPTSFASTFPDITHDILQLSLPVEDTTDVLVWPFSKSGHLSFTDAYYYFKPTTSDVSWAHHLWKHYIPPKLSTLTWRLLLNALPTDDNLQKSDTKPSLRKSVLHIRSLLRDIGKLSFGHMDNTQSDLLVLHSLGVSAIPKKAPIVSEVCWHPPPPIWLKLNTDGLAKGNPGPAVAGDVFRNCRGFVKGIFSFNIGVQSAFYAELLAVILGIEQAWGKVVKVTVTGPAVKTHRCGWRCRGNNNNVADGDDVGDVEIRVDD
ncbi:hypothetical protein L1049_017538 [Liquidambar formosana]|uniref:RNase H type-1 domain-containing protein n=1 Tax=Liquidambar formosana TaxID=63359 RepID=A0AAP0S7L7_LIQFO